MVSSINCTWVWLFALACIFSLVSAYDNEAGWSLQTYGVTNPYGVAVANFDNDNYDDIIFSGENNDVYIAFSNGAGISSSTVVRTVDAGSTFDNGNPYRFYCTHVNDDEFIDCVATVYSESYMGYFQNSGTRTANSWTFHLLSTLGDMSGPVVFNVDNLNRPDLVYIQGTNIRVAKSTHPSNGLVPGSYSLSTVGTTSSDAWDTNVVFFDGDAYGDLVVGLGTGIAVYKNKYATGGTFSTSPDMFQSVGDAYNIEVADINGDGIDDIVYVGDHVGYIALYGNSAFETFKQLSPHPSIVSHQFSAISVFDIDSDGDNDVVVFKYTASGDHYGSTYVWENTQTSFPHPTWNQFNNLAGYDPQRPLDGLAYGDFDG